MSRAVGPDTARRGLNHAPGGTTLEEHYEQGNFDLAVMAIALGGDVVAAQRAMMDMSSPTLTRLADQSNIPARIDETCEVLRKIDKNLIKATKEGDRFARNTANQRIHRHAYVVAYKEEKIAADNLTVQEVYTRRAQLRDSTRFMRIVCDHLVGFDGNVPESVADYDELYDFRDADEVAASEKIQIIEALDRASQKCLFSQPVGHRKTIGGS
ncbi:hypothetical protein BKA65DRAFT_237480 [Rhexocercosporidium sp. MPI-PUGE-AT-0058]|nr:hypothetical protein BKA65DRAFT_237480 [Rhexocercosporidium sp. MPI-PUGE-AT-0058]